jgi:hypothetical protein
MQRLVTRLFAPLRLPTILGLLAWAAVSSAIAQTLSGTVKSGTAAIPGATVTVYSAGYDRGVAPNVLASAVTDGSGHFLVRYPQPHAGNVLYVTAKGPAAGVDLAAILGTYRAPRSPPHGRWRNS